MASWREALSNLIESGKPLVVISDDTDLGAITMNEDGSYDVECEHCSTATGSRPIRVRSPKDVDRTLEEFDIPKTGWW
jgi:hypothetical protein